MFEVSWHSGARPSHQEWQGKWYTHAQLVSVCGLGEVSGLCGANCYHDYYPVIPGISEPTYSAEQLADMKKSENTPIKDEVTGKEYTKYEALQRQRKLETQMRADRQTIKLLQEAGADEDDIINARCRYQGHSQEYTRFSKAMDMPQQRARVNVDGLGNIGVGKTSGGSGKASPIKVEKVGAKVNKVTTTDKSKLEFTPAKSIEEAQEYAKKYIELSAFSKTFGGIADFKGIDLENANSINKALTNVFETVDMSKISGIKVVSPTSRLGKKAFKDGADAVFSYSPVEHGIFVNKDILKSTKSFEDYVSRSEKAWNDVMQNIDKLSGSSKELALTYKNAGRSLADGQTVEGMFTHELGHHAQWTLLDTKTNNAVGSKMAEYAPKISGYANASKSEYLAESFSAYMKGEKKLLDSEYVVFMDNKLLDKSGGSGIIKERVTSRNLPNGLRTEPSHILSDSEVKSLKSDIQAIGADENIFKFNVGRRTGYDDVLDEIRVKGDVLPDVASNHPRDKMSSRAALAHEYYGHRAYRGTSLQNGSWNDEFRASYMAAKNCPNLTDEDRRYLILDALERAKESGVTIKSNDFIRRTLYGY